MVQFPEDVKDQEKMCVMKIEAEGLMPLDGSLKFGPGYVAIDVFLFMFFYCLFSWFFLKL